MATVTTLIRQQHDRVKSLIGEIEQSSGEDRRIAFEDLVRLLAVHETAEEEVVYPTLRNEPGGDPIVDARTQEEDEAKKALSHLESDGVQASDFDQEFARLKRMVLEHAEEEERTVLPLLEANESTERLESMGKMFETAERFAPTHPHPHAPESAVGNLVVGPFAAVVDRVRDALKKR